MLQDRILILERLCSNKLEPNCSFALTAVANFYDVNGVEEYNLINGTLSVIKEIFPVSANPFSVVAVDLNLRSKAIVSRS